ncbi:hypothetical protein [Sphingomonas sp. SRS2]|uniref:hypothetical protein n=1 Tax=Sphingomonas sp. SRS2 TaxID=133190 RepID=UPI00061847B1|nr:hypothetical protein [Sphingomonas sp. SRS2]KKC27446.1 hypothetical protein WP12_03465 [Sphingomonas sp. SRS2]
MKHSYVLTYDLKTGAPLQWTEKVSDEEIAAAARAASESGWGVIACDEMPIKHVEIVVGDQKYPVVQVDTEAVKRSALARIDRGVGEELARHITPGMDETYREKLDEARSHKKRGAKTPLLAAEAKAKGRSVPEIAADVLARADACRAIRHRLEDARQTAKAIVREADNLIDVVEAETTDWAALAAEQGV